MGDACAAELPSTLPILLERRRNEITRITAVKTFAAIVFAKRETSLTAPLSSGSGTILQAVDCSLLTTDYYLLLTTTYSGTILQGSTPYY